MANSYGYDHPHYTIRRFFDGNITAGTGTQDATNAPAHFSPFAENLWNVHFRVVTQSTATGASYRVINVTSGLTTSTIATTTVGTAVIGSTFGINSLTNGTATAFALAAGSLTTVTTLLDNALVGRVAWEIGTPNTANFTASNGQT